jgi:hypothetical protein
MAFLSPFDRSNVRLVQTDYPMFTITAICSIHPLLLHVHRFYHFHGFGTRRGKRPASVFFYLVFDVLEVSTQIIPWLPDRFAYLFLSRFRFLRYQEILLSRDFSVCPWLFSYLSTLSILFIQNPFRFFSGLIQQVQVCGKAMSLVTQAASSINCPRGRSSETGSSVFSVSVGRGFVSVFFRFSFCLNVFTYTSLSVCESSGRIPFRKRSNELLSRSSFVVYAFNPRKVLQTRVFSDLRRRFLVRRFENRLDEQGA